MGNWFKTTLLLGAMTALIVWIGGLFGGKQGMIMAFILAMGMNFFSYWYSDKIVLKMYRAKEVGPNDFPGLYNAVSQLAHNAALPMPRVYIIPEESPNAFATGRNPEHAVIAVTEGLLKSMNDEEATGVLAHEMSHIKNRDILIGSIAATMAGAIMILATMARWTAFFGGGSNDDEGGGRSWHNRPDCHVNTCADRGHAYSDGHLQIKGIRGRCHGGTARRQSRRPGKRPREIRGFIQAAPHEGQSFHCPHVYHKPPLRQKHDEPLFDPSTPRGEDSPAQGEQARSADGREG